MYVETEEDWEQLQLDLEELESEVFIVFILDTGWPTYQVFKYAEDAYAYAEERKHKGPTEVVKTKVNK